MAINTDVFLGSGANLALVPETDLYITTQTSGSSTTKLVAHGDFQSNYLLVENLYVGCVMDLFATGTTTPLSSHIITENDSTSVTFSPPCRTPASGDFIVIRSYGAPNVGQKNGSVKRLNADNWLGILESATFAVNPNSNGLSANAAGDVYIDVGGGGGGEKTTTTHLSQGPIFYKTGYATTGTKGTALTPPLNMHLDDDTAMYKLTRPYTILGTVKGTLCIVGYCILSVNILPKSLFILINVQKQMEKNFLLLL